MANVLELMDYVSQQGKQGRAEGQQRRLSSLAPKVIAGDEAATSEAMGLDPNTAKAYLGEHDRQLQQLRGAAKYMKQALATGNPQAINGAYQAVRPWLSKVAGQPAPEQWTPDMEQKMEQALAQTAYLDQGDVGSRVQSTQIDNEGNIWTVDRNGNWTNSGIKASPSGTVINQPGNVPFMAVTGRGPLGAAAPIGPPGGNAPAPTAPGSPTFESNGMPVNIDPSVDPRIAGAIQGNPDAAGVADNIRLPQQQPLGSAPMQPQGPGPIRNPTPAETAAASAAATGSVRPMTEDERKAWNIPDGAAVGINDLTGKPEVLASGAQEKKVDPIKMEKYKQQLQKIESARTGAINSYDDFITAIEELKRHPGFKSLGTATGAATALVNPWSDANGAKQRLQSIMDRNVIQTMAALKNMSATGATGFGQLSEKEGARLENSRGPLTSYQGHDDLLDSLDKLEIVLKRDRDNIANLDSGLKEPEETSDDAPKGQSKSNDDLRSLWEN